MSLIFKNATKADIPVISQLADHIWKKHYITIITIEQIEYMLKKIYSAESIGKQMEDGQQYTLVYENLKPVGYTALSTVDDKNYFLHKFYVEVSEHRKGIGSQLFEHLLKTNKTVETIELVVNRENYKAINFYFKKGFVIKQIINQDIGEGYFMNDFIMIRKKQWNT